MNNKYNAMTIFTNLDSNDYDDQEKGTAIYDILKMETHNSITKAQLMNACMYLLKLHFEIPDKVTA